VGEGQGGGSFLRCNSYCFNNPSQIAQHLFIGESKHSESLRYEPIVAYRVTALALREIARFAVEFDD